MSQIPYLLAAAAALAAAPLQAQQAEATEPARATAGPRAPAGPEVLTGLDVLVEDSFALLAGRKVGLIANHTARDRHGAGIVDVFLRQDRFELKALFSPEHGFQGALDQTQIPDSTHPSGLPIRSLYGADRKPSAESLRGIDTLVFDIQDIGCRFYTYVSTMELAMEAAAEHGIRFVVLDRPNPIGGVAVAGPVLDEGLESFVGCHTIPVRHGMTVGELARMLDEERAIGGDLRVVGLQGWRRSMAYDETGLLWVDPSPNMRNLNQAFLYPGVGLLETTNLSVGRGTDTPFEVLGAPFIDGRAFARTLNAQGLLGVRFVPIEFTPDASKFRGQLCSGVHILITDRARFEPLATGMTLAWALRRLCPDDWDTSRYPRLLGDRAVFDALLEGAEPVELMALWQDELAAFTKRRAKFLIYR